MKKESSRNIQVGLFVSIGTVLLIVALYLIGNKQNLFGSTFRISAKFHNVNGLMVGNNVRFSGIDIGTVEEIEIINDSSVNVVMIIEERVQPYIKKNAIASIGTDGLMGNKLVNINSGNNHSESIEKGDVLITLRPIETDEMLRTLNTTNDNVQVISSNLQHVSQKINNSNSLWNLLMDTVVAENVKDAIVNIKITSNRSATVIGDLSSIVKDIKSGNGLIGKLIADSSFSNKLGLTIDNIKTTSDSIGFIAGDLKVISKKIKDGEGAAGTLLTDTTFVNNLNKSMENIRNGSQGFNENMEALKHNFLLRKYFRKKERKEKK